MKKTKKILSLLLALSMALAATACDKKEEPKEDPKEVAVTEPTEEPKEAGLTVDEAEKHVKAFLDVVEDVDFENAEFLDFATEDLQNDMENIGKKYGFTDDEDEDNAEGEEIAKAMMDFNYDISSSKEKDGKVVVTVDMSNKDYSFFNTMASLQTEQDFLGFFQNAVNNGLLTVAEVQSLPQATEEPPLEDMVKIYDKLSGGKRISKTVNLTVIKDGDKVRVDEIDNMDDFFSVFTLNMLGAL